MGFTCNCQLGYLCPSSIYINKTQVQYKHRENNANLWRNGCQYSLIVAGNSHVEKDLQPSYTERKKKKNTTSKTSITILL